MSESVPVHSVGRERCSRDGPCGFISSPVGGDRGPVKESFKTNQNVQHLSTNAGKGLFPPF